MTSNQWKTLFGVVAAISSFLMVQPQVQAIPVLMIVLGCINVALAVVNPSDRATA